MKFKNTFCTFAIFIALLFTINTTNAQTVSTAYETQINSTFAGIDKTKVPHKLLVDYAMEFAELSAFNGTLTNDNFVHRGTYTSIYNTLLMARVQTNVTGLISPTIFKTNWDNLRQPNTIVLSGLYYKYSKFKDNASPNLITINNNKLYDKYVNGVWQNPYETKQVFAIASPILKYNSLTLDVKLPSSLWYTNQASSIQSIAIDFDDGNGYQTMTFGQSKTISYSQADIYDWTYKLTLTNNQVLYSHSKLQIDATVPTVQSNERRTINEPCDLDVFGIDEVEFVGTQTYLGIANTATLQIDYRTGNDCEDGITKPLIVAEGFDSGLLGVENPLGESDIQDFLDESTIGAGNLGVEIGSYDIIYVNWDQGRDFLQRNALLLEDIITWVNSVKTTNEQNVVLGQSMGGVIARYALADMESNVNLNHDAKLYISHDAPHQGANIPIGIQFFARHMIDQFVSTPLGDFNLPVNNGGAISIEDIEAVFNAPGTKQLLANNINSSFNLNNSLHNSWQNELENKGYPQLTRNIAISNGNHCATPQIINPEDILFSLSGEVKAGLLTDILIQYIPILGTINDLAFVGLAILFNEPALLAGIIPGNSKFNWDFWVKALPAANTTKQIYKGKITFTKKVLWVINLTLNITDRSFDNQGINLSYDYYPGGYFPVPLDLGTANTDLNNLFVSLNINAYSADEFNFIPTISALDVGSGNSTLFDSDYLEVYTAIDPPNGNYAIPFDNFTTSYTPNSDLNEAHISFNTRNGNWLAEELDADTTVDIFDCSFVCDVTEITGSDYLCSSGGTYSVPSGADNVTWSFSPSNAAQITSGQGTNTVTLAINSGYNNSFTLTAYLTSGAAKCNATNTITKTIWAGNPKIPTSLTGPTLVNTGALVNYKSGTSQGAATYKWLLPYPFGVSNPIDYFSQNWQMAPTTGVNLTAMTGYGQNAGLVQVMGENSCGCSGAKTLYVQHGIGGGGGIPIADDGTTEIGTPFNYFKVYPNPSSKVVFINLLNENDKPEKAAKVYGELYDLYGNLKQRVYMNNNKAMLNVSRLVSGIYVLHIYVGNTVENHKIIVK